MRAMRVLLGLLVVVALGTAGFLAWAWRPSIAAVDPPPRSAFDPAWIARGAQLSAAGNCMVCHTIPGGKPYAGGRPLPTPFGTINATNITPDVETGIGGWSEAAFTRAMREGVDREGRHLYPAFPYDHFTRMTDEDIRALYAFIMTRDPVQAENPPNDLPFPLNLRITIAGWKLLYLDRGPVPPDLSKDVEWNRGAYLVEGVAHCGACHTPRNALGAEKKEQNLAGGESEGWHAPALNEASPAPVPWTAERLFTYLRRGREELHGTAAGPMAPVVHNLAQVPETDVRAIAAYVGSILGAPTPERMKRAEAALARASERRTPATVASGDETVGQSGNRPPEIAAIYAGACGVCHDNDRGINLALSTSINAPTARNLIHFLFEGVQPPVGEAGPFMPGFEETFTDEQIAALAAYLRSQFSNRPPWPDIAGEVSKIRREREKS
jgi:mono/diheme cytochrome c family protein